MVMLSRLKVLGAKVESVIGTAESLTNAEGAFNAYNVMIQPNIPMETREAQGSFNDLSQVPSGYQGTATFRTDLGWDGTTTMPSWASVFLPACGFVESSQVYTPRSEAPGSNVKTLTIGAYINGHFRSIAGAVGTFQLVLPSGRMGYIDWTFTGVWQAPSDETIIAPTYPTAKPIKFTSATCTYNSVGMKVESMTIDAGNVIHMREDATTAAGFISGVITSRAPRISANPESVLAATQDRFAAWIASTEAALSVVLDGPTDSTITISVPKAQIINLQEGNRGGIVTDEIEFSANKNGATADQEVSITFTEAT